MPRTGEGFPMFVNRVKIRVEFGDCDPANIVYFATYFRWFDRCTSALFRAAGIPLEKGMRDGAGGVRWANAEEMAGYVGPGIGERGFQRTVDWVGERAALEEALFTGLRLVEGVSLTALRREFGPPVEEVDFGGMDGLLERDGDRVRLTPAGRLVSNEVFGRLLLEPAAV